MLGGVLVVLLMLLGKWGLSGSRLREGWQSVCVCVSVGSGHCIKKTKNGAIKENKIVL